MLTWSHQSIYALKGTKMLMLEYLFHTASWILFVVLVPLNYYIFTFSGAVSIVLLLVLVVCQLLIFWLLLIHICAAVFTANCACVIQDPHFPHLLSILTFALYIAYAFKGYFLLLLNFCNVGQTSWSSRHLLLSNWCFWTTQFGLYGSPRSLGIWNIFSELSWFFRCNFYSTCAYPLNMVFVLGWNLIRTLST